MKTSVVLDEKKVALAKKIAQSSTLREVLDQALDAFISQGRRRQLAEMLGTNFFSGDLNLMRDKEKSKRARR